jgi:hypothetical protein
MRKEEREEREEGEEEGEEEEAEKLMKWEVVQRFEIYTFQKAVFLTFLTISKIQICQ